MNKWLKISMALTGITLTGAGAFYLYANYKSLDDLDFSIEDVKFKGSSDTLTIKVSIKLKNPTDFNLKVYGYSFDLNLEGTYIGTAKSEDVTEVRKNSEQMITIPFEVYKSSFDLAHINELIKLLTKAVKKENMSAKINGSITAGFNRVIKTTIDFKDYEVYAINE